MDFFHRYIDHVVIANKNWIFNNKSSINGKSDGKENYEGQNWGEASNFKITIGDVIQEKFLGSIDYISGIRKSK